MTPGLEMADNSDIFIYKAIPQPGVNQLTYVLEERYLGATAYDQ